MKPTLYPSPNSSKHFLERFPKNNSRALAGLPYLFLTCLFLTGFIFLPSGHILAQTVLPSQLPSSSSQPFRPFRSAQPPSSLSQPLQSSRSGQYPSTSSSQPSQPPQPICGFDVVHARKMKEDPSYRRNVLAGETSIRNYIRQHPISRPAPPTVTTATGSTIPLTTANATVPTRLGTGSGNNKTTTTGSDKTISSGSSPVYTLSGPPYTIPVVVHVIHTGGPVGSVYNPTDDQILHAIAYLDSVYNGTEPGAQGAGDLQIQFVLAQRDPNCNPTNGINRVDGSGVAGYVSGGVNAQTTLGTPDINIKDLSRWDPTQYYNIWIVDKIDGNDGTSGQFVAGYAYFPGSSSSEDGIVMLATQMIDGQKTLPHEIGHAFNLYHPFQGSTDMTVCPANTDCSVDGDQICDTDPIAYNYNAGTGVINFNCLTGTNSCTGTTYSINTESNYMNYTNCYTLFTPDQKARMQASAVSIYRSSLTTSQGGLPPYAGSSPCTIPKIDFQLTGDQETETTAAITGCRAYKDYSYTMVIGIAPSATATATLNVSSGTAVQGTDFDITTNGSFTAPSQQLSFAAGANASQPFTIRVYDDASVNGTRTVTLGYTLNNGGGNAVIGDGRPNFTMIIDDNDVAPSGPHSATASIGSFQGYDLPGLMDATKNKTQFIYYPSELLAAGIFPGNLTALALNIYKSSSASYVYQGLTIKMGLTSQTTLYNGAFLNEAAFTTVFSSNYSTVNGWNNFTFSTPFAWDGVSSVVVEVCYDNGTASDNPDYPLEYADGTGAANYTYFYSNGTNCGTPLTSPNYYTGNKPIIRFTYTVPATAVQTVVNSSQTQELGPNADIYFYDKVNSQLMARIQNMTTFDYGCTQVVIDRAGTNATQFWNTSTPNYLMDKTFHVLPTTNNPSGSYNITLYYTQAEVSGWEAFTGQSLSAIQLVKVPTQIPNVTAANPSGGGTVTLATPAISTVGTNTGLTYNFTNGFSGFGAGVPGLSPLPVGLMNFTGQREGDNAVLNWETSFEQGSKGFEIDRAFDGNNFTKIGYVPAAGNSVLPRHYTFTDPSLTQDNNYYRLQQIDLDDKSTYSNIVLVRAAPGASFTVLSNPFTDNLDILFGQVATGQAQVRLLDMTGREILRQPAIAASGSRLHIDISGSSLSAGVYLLEVRVNNSVQVAKVVKK